MYAAHLVKEFLFLCVSFCLLVVFGIKLNVFSERLPKSGHREADCDPSKTLRIRKAITIKLRKSIVRSEMFPLRSPRVRDDRI